MTNYVCRRVNTKLLLFDIFLQENACYRISCVEVIDISFSNFIIVLFREILDMWHIKIIYLTINDKLST